MGTWGWPAEGHPELRGTASQPNVCCSTSPPSPAQVNVFLEGNKDLPSLTPTGTDTSSGGGGSGLSAGAVAGICVGGALPLGWPDGWGAAAALMTCGHAQKGRVGC